jgi:hypothetical protein
LAPNALLDEVAFSLVPDPYGGGVVAGIDEHQEARERDRKNDE